MAGRREVRMDTLGGMRALNALNATSLRIQRPVTWGAILLFGVLWNLTPWSLGAGIPPANEIAFPFLWGFAFLALSPVPWQWTRDERRLASLGRGLLQAIPWNAAWALSLLLFADLTPHDGVLRPYRSAYLTDAQKADLEAGRTRREEGRPRPRPGMERPRHASPLGIAIPPRLLVMAVANLCFGILLGWILADKERAEASEHEAVRVAGEARARALQSQMNPHVLFNAISGLTELVREDPGATERALVSLSGLLRSLLDYSARSVAPLLSERVLVEQYLALEQIRLGKRLRVTWLWDASLEDREVPPLLLQPLVENALKHGIAPHRGGGELGIFLRKTGLGMELEVANTGAPLSEAISEGIGLRNLKERLGLFLPQASLRLFTEAEWTRAVLSLNGDPS